MIKVRGDTFRLDGFRLGSELLNNESITLEIMSEPKSYLMRYVLRQLVFPWSRLGYMCLLLIRKL